MRLCDDTSLFTIVKDKSESSNILNNDLSEISKWAYNLKMLFNPDPSKPAQEVVFSRKKKEQSHPGISLNNIQVERTSYHKHLGLILDEKLNFKQHVDSALLKMNKGISVIKKIKVFLATKIFAYNLQSLFATPNRLWRYHLRPTPN